MPVAIIFWLAQETDMHPLTCVCVHWRLTLGVVPLHLEAVVSHWTWSSPTSKAGQPRNSRDPLCVYWDDWQAPLGLAFRWIPEIQTQALTLPGKHYGLGHLPSPWSYILNHITCLGKEVAHATDKSSPASSFNISLSCFILKHLSANVHVTCHIQRQWTYWGISSLGCKCLCPVLAQLQSQHCCTECLVRTTELYRTHNTVYKWVKYSVLNFRAD